MTLNSNDLVKFNEPNPLDLPQNRLEKKRTLVKTMSYLTNGAISNEKSTNFVVGIICVIILILSLYLFFGSGEKTPDNQKGVQSHTQRVKNNSL